MVEALAAQFAAMAKEVKATQRQVAALEANLEAEVAQQARPPGALGSFGFRIRLTPQLGVSAFESGLPLGSARWRRGADRSTTGATCRAKGRIARARCIR